MAVAAEHAKPVALATEAEIRPRSYWQDTWVLFSANRLAVVGLVLVILMVTLALTADFWQSLGLIADPYKQYANSSRQDPMTCANPVNFKPGEPQYCFIGGSDEFGRDLFSRVIYGTRVSLAVGIIGALVAILVGTIYGLIAGYFGGAIDNMMMRFIDFMYGVPELILIIMLQVFFSSLGRYANVPEYRETFSPIVLLLIDLDKRMSGLFFVFVSLGLLSWVGVARQTRGQVLSFKQKEFVEAARSIGARDGRIIFLHILPNIFGILIVITALAIPGFIFTESVLSFLGLGAQDPIPTWGKLIDYAYQSGFRLRPYLVVVPGFMLTLTTLAFVFLGDGLRDAFDPRLRGTE